MDVLRSAMYTTHKMCYNAQASYCPELTETNPTQHNLRGTLRTTKENRTMRITTTTNTTNTTDDASSKTAYITKQKSKLSRLASSLGANDKSYQLASRLERWAEVDPAQAEAHSAALATLLEATEAVRKVVAHLDSLPEGYNPSAPKKAAKSKFEVGAPVAVKESKLEEYQGLIEDPRCLKVVEVRKTVILIETTDGVRFPIAKAALEVIA